MTVAFQTTTSATTSETANITWVMLHMHFRSSASPDTATPAPHLDMCSDLSRLNQHPPPQPAPNTQVSAYYLTSPVVSKTLGKTNGLGWASAMGAAKSGGKSLLCFSRPVDAPTAAVAKNLDTSGGAAVTLFQPFSRSCVNNSPVYLPLRTPPTPSALNYHHQLCCSCLVQPASRYHHLML
jgi:hypothetical protein